MFSYNDNLLPMENDTQEIFVEGIKKLFADENKERKRLKKKKLTWAEVAEKLNTTPANVSSFVGLQRSYSESKQKELAKIFKKTYLEVFDIGRMELLRDGDLSCAFPSFQMTGQATHTPAPVISLQDEADKKHAAVIAKFEDKERAVEINEMLVEIEKLEGTNGLEAIKKYISYQLNEAREKKGLAPLQSQQKNGTSNQPS